MMSNVTDAVMTELPGDNTDGATSWRPGENIAGLLNITVSLSSGHTNVSILYGSGTETWESLSTTETAMVYDRHVPNYSQLTLTMLCVVLGCMIVATILGNVFVITAILVERSLHGVSNYLILSLAVTDLLVAVLVMPLSLLDEVSVYWYLGRVLCDMWVSVDVLCCTASILHLVAITMDRFWAVSKIDYVRRRCARQILVMIAVVWLVSVAISIPPMFGWRHESDNPELSGVCMISQDHGYTIFSTVGAFYCPLVLMLVLNFKIYRAARYRIRRKGFTQPARKSRRTGHTAVPVVHVEQETTLRDAMRNSSGSDISQDGMSMFNPSCLVNNELSRLDMDSNTGDYDQAYSYYGGESSDSRQNDSYYLVATEDPDCPLPTPCFAMGAVQQVGDKDVEDCMEGGAKCSHLQLNAVNHAPPPSSQDTENWGLRNTGCCSGNHLTLINHISPATEMDLIRSCMEVNGDCAQHEGTISTSRASPLTDIDVDRSYLEADANCNHCQLNSMSHASSLSDIDLDRSCTEADCEDNQHHQLNSAAHTPSVTDIDLERACTEVEGHLERVCTEVEGHLERACTEVEGHCCQHRRSAMSHASSAFSDVLLDRPGLESSTCGRPQVSSVFKSLSSGHLPGSTPCPRSEAPVRHRSTSALDHCVSGEVAPVALSNSSDVNHCVSCDLHSAPDVNHCVCCDVVPLNQQGSQPSTMVVDPSSIKDSRSIEITVQDCDSPVTDCRLVHSAEGDAELAKASEPLLSAEEEASLGDAVDGGKGDRSVNRHVGAPADHPPVNMLSVQLSCVASNHLPHPHELQKNHVAAEPARADPQTTQGCHHIHANTNCLLVPNAHNSSTAATTTSSTSTTSTSNTNTTTTTTSLSPLGGGQGNQLKVPHLTSVHTRQPSKSRANNNTKRARNREKEKQRREKLEMRRERKAARVLGIITGAFVLCWLPFFLVALLGPFLPTHCHIPPVLFSLFLWLGYFNSLLNPIIYTIFNPSFRKAFRKIFFKRLSSMTRS